jgi:hypothetical protein
MIRMSRKINKNPGLTMLFLGNTFFMHDLTNKKSAFVLLISFLSKVM